MKTLLPLIAVLFLLSCKKKNNCTSEVNTIDTEDITVVVGWPIKLKTDYISTTITNKWSGSNNWSASTTEGESEITVTNEANHSHTGYYYANSFSYNDCLAQRKTIQVHVIEPPHAPCSINENSISISSPIIYQANYTQVNSYIQDNRFVVNASNGNESITLTFNNAQDPKPGINTLYQGVITTGQGYLLDSGEFYVQKINGHLVISFCDAIFYNPAYIETDILISGEITIQ